MSRRTKEAAMSRRTRRADQQQQPAPALAHPTMVSNNPIFFRGDGDPVHALVHGVLDDVPAAVGKPLPLPPSRTPLSAGSGRAGSALVVSRHGSGWVVLRRVPRDDPFLAAYVACSKSGGGGGKVDPAPAKQQQKKNKNIGDAVQGCGIWSGWGAGAKYAGAVSCKYGCDVVAVQGGGPVATAQAQASQVPRLHLSRQLVVIPARKRALPRGPGDGRRVDWPREACF